MDSPIVALFLFPLSGNAYLDLAKYAIIIRNTRVNRYSGVQICYPGAFDKGLIHEGDGCMVRIKIR